MPSKLHLNRVYLLNDDGPGEEKKKKKKEEKKEKETECAKKRKLGLS